VSELFKWRLESAQKYDDSERSLDDVLDVKASVALVAVTFLAGVSAQLITKQGLTPLWSKIQLPVQIVALLLLSVAGALIITELWPADYSTLPTPKADADWIEKLGAAGKDSVAVLDAVLNNKLSSAIERVEHNKKITDRKSVLLHWAFKLLAFALTLVLGNLLPQ
jgi:predicted membrane protein